MNQQNLVIAIEELIAAYKSLRSGVILLEIGPQQAERKLDEYATRARQLQQQVKTNMEN